MNTQFRMLAALAAGALLSSVGSVAQESSTSCPMEIKSVRVEPLIRGTVTPTEGAPQRGKLLFRYTNISGRDIQTVSLRVSGRMQVSGPTGPSSLETSQNVVVEGPMRVGKPKTASVKLSVATWGGLHVELRQVKFTDGALWTNEADLECVD